MKIKKAKKLVYNEIVSETSLFDKLYDLICIVDAEANVVYVNKAFCVFTQLDKKKIEGNKLIESLKIVDENDKEIDPVIQCLESKKYLGLREVNAILNNEDECSIQLGIQPLYENEELDNVFGFILNIQDKSLEYNLHKKYRKTIDKIEEDFNESVKIFANITDMIDHKSDLSVKMSSLALKIAQHLNLNEKECREISVAARLRNIGTLGMNPVMLEKEMKRMSKLEKDEYEKFPVMGSLIFEGIPAFENICTYIRTHQENVDGKGFPMGLSGDDVPIGGNILCLVNDFYKIEGNDEDEKVLRLKVEKIQRHQEVKYHPMVVDAFLGVITDKSIFKQRMERKEVGVEALKTGMILSKNLFSSKGILLLQADERISASSLKRIHSFHENDPITEQVQIYQAVDTAVLSKRIKEDKENQKKLEILVVDDTQDLNMLMCMMLNRHERYKAEGLFNAQSALEKIATKKYDAYILDIMMPGMSGIELLQQLRDAGDVTPVVMCTAKSSQEDVIDAFKKGADDYIIKPVVQETLIKGLDKVLDYQENSGSGVDFKSYRKQQMLEVLKIAAPEALIREQPRLSNFQIQFKYANKTDEKAMHADAYNISKEGLHLQSEDEVAIGERIVFSLIKKDENKVLLVGMANVASVDEKENSYKIEFINVRKR